MIFVKISNYFFSLFLVKKNQNKCLLMFQMDRKAFQAIKISTFKNNTFAPKASPNDFCQKCERVFANRWLENHSRL